MNLRNYVVGFPYDPDTDSIALILKTHPKEQAGLYNGVGGRIEIGESPVQAMVREAFEEANLETSKDNWLKFHYERHVSGTCLHFYICACTPYQWQHTQTTTEEEVHKFHLSKLPKKMMYNLHWLIPMGLCYLNHPQHRYLEG